MHYGTGQKLNCMSSSFSGSSYQVGTRLTDNHTSHTQNSNSKHKNSPLNANWKANVCRKLHICFVYASRFQKLLRQSQKVLSISHDPPSIRCQGLSGVEAGCPVMYARVWKLTGTGCPTLGIQTPNTLHLQLGNWWALTDNTPHIVAVKFALGRTYYTNDDSHQFCNWLSLLKESAESKIISFLSNSRELTC
jgi:hypothetical protein